MSSYISRKSSCKCDTGNALTADVSSKQTSLFVAVDETFQPISDVVTTVISSRDVDKLFRSIFKLFKSIFKIYLSDIFL